MCVVVFQEKYPKLLCFSVFLLCSCLYVESLGGVSQSSFVFCACFYLCVFVCEVLWSSTRVSNNVFCAFATYMVCVFQCFGVVPVYVTVPM